jgi:hypothetical protein
MYETPEDIEQLQILLARSIEQAGLFLRESFEMPAHSLSARQLLHFWQGLQTVALATVTGKGEPRVAPVGALLLRGRFYIPTVASAIRAQHILRNPAISFTCYQQNGLAVIVHGHASVIRPGDADFAAIEAFQREKSGVSVQEWGEGIFLEIFPNAIYTYARFPERYAEG